MFIVRGYERIAEVYERVAVLSGVSACFRRTFLIKRRFTYSIFKNEPPAWHDLSLLSLMTAVYALLNSRTAVTRD